MIEMDKVEVQTKFKEKKLEDFVGLLKGKEILECDDERYNSILFESNIPNKETKKAIEEARKGMNMSSISVEEIILERKK